MTKEQAEASYMECLARERRNRIMKTTVILIPLMLIIVVFLAYVLVV
jgi:preprotein translocase subunit SecG